MEPILALPVPSVTTLQVCIAIDATAQSLYNSLYKDLVVTIIMTKNC